LRLIVWIVAALGVIAAIALVFDLWRRVRSGREPWTGKQSLEALALLVAIFAMATPVLVDSDSDDETDPAVVAYRQQVRATCTALRPASNPMVEAMNEDGTFDRGRLEQGLRNQLLGAQGVLDGLWAQPVPTELADTAASAHSAADALMAATSAAIDQMTTELPATIPFNDLAAWVGQLNAQLLPPSTTMEGAMSQLAGDTCQVPATASPG
jgi:uncharacterized membrane protein YccC